MGECELGMKGSISEFELGVLRARMYEAARAKAQRGELRISVPFGYVWHRDYGLGFDPDIRLQETIRLIFARFRELGSARQVLISMIDDGVHFPRPSDGKKMVSFAWVPVRYRNVISVLKNPFYAGDSVQIDHPCIDFAAQLEQPTSRLSRNGPDWHASRQSTAPT